MFKKFLTILVVLIGIFALIFGWKSYHSKINGLAKGSSSMTRETSSVSSSSKEVKSDSKYYKNIPKDIQSKLDKAVLDKKTVNLTFVMKANTTVTDDLEKEMKKAYGEKTWKFNLVTYNTENSTQLLGEQVQNQVAATHPDLILYEAPLFNDNQTIQAEESLISNEQLLEAFKATKASILVQPSPPIYKGVIYPVQEEKFKQEISAKYPYLDYWTAFPAQDSDEMKTLVVDDGNYQTLNDAGNKKWANYLKEYFVSK